MTILDAIETFSSKRAASYSTYHSALSQFVVWLERERAVASHCPIESLCLAHALSYADDLQAIALDPKTRDYYRATVTRFYKYLARQRILAIDIYDLEMLAESVRDMKSHAKPLPRLPSDQDIEKLIHVARSEPSRQHPTEPAKRRADLRAFRNVALLEALRSSAARISELLGLTRGDLRPTDHAARVTGKGDQERIIYFSPQAWAAIQEYLRARQDGVHVRALGSQPLFARHDQGAGKDLQPLSRSGAERIFDELVERAGLQDLITPHWLRHSAAMKMYEETGDIETVSQWLGHKRLETTRVYAHASNKRVRTAHRAVFGE